MKPLKYGIMLVIIIIIAMSAGCTSTTSQPSSVENKQYQEIVIQGNEIAEMSLTGTVSEITSFGPGLFNGDGYTVTTTDGRRIDFYNYNEPATDSDEDMLIAYPSQGRNLTVYDTYKWTSKKYTTSSSWLLTNVTKIASSNEQ